MILCCNDHRRSDRSRPDRRWSVGPQVVEDEEIDALQRGDQASETAFTARLSEIGEQARSSLIEDGKAIASHGVSIARCCRAFADQPMDCDRNHLAIVGPTGTGKSWLACALGNKACRDGFAVLYKRASRLFADLAQARGEGRLARLIAALERVNLLILDDWGPEPLTADQRRDLLEIVDDRYDKGSLLITSQVPVSQWHDVIADPTLGDAILDRIIHNAHRIELKGDSLRRHAGEKKKA